MSKRSASSKQVRAVVDDAMDDATDAVLLVSRALVGLAAKSLAATEDQITLPQYRALVVLDSRGDQNVSTLADTLGIHPSTLTRLCDRLIEKRWIERRTSGESRREVTLGLSEKGRALVRAETERRRRAIREIVERVDPATQSAIADVFSALAEAAEEVHGHAWKLGWTA
jgi:DNA-binding MarR family transcriptional regulator